MTDANVLLRKRLRHVLAPILATPIHPQWLISKQGRDRTDWVSRRAVGTVLDIGCADGGIRATLTRVSEYHGLDYPRTAQGLYGTRPEIFGDARRLPFQDRSFDTVMLLDVLEHVPDPELALNEASRVLRSGGRLLLTIPFAYPLHDQPHDYQRLTEHGLARRIQQAGLQIELIQPVGISAEVASANLSMALAQAGIEAITCRSWRMVWLPFLPMAIVLVNLSGWCFGKMWPTRQMLPGAYFVEAKNGDARVG
jgi:SAM-dependent methyltransferase